MTGLPVVSSSLMARMLRSLGFVLVRQRGSHGFFRHPDGRCTVVPMHKGEVLGRGLIRAILRAIEVSPDEFRRLVSGD